MQDATAKVCTAVQLDNGEQLPTLQQYLDKAKSLKTRLILELKAHKTPEQETRAVAVDRISLYKCGKGVLSRTVCSPETTVGNDFLGLDSAACSKEQGGSKK